MLPQQQQQQPLQQPMWCRHVKDVSDAGRIVVTTLLWMLSESA